MLKIASLTDIGLKRDHNEDAHLVNQAKGLIVVADGLGAYENGETASYIAAKTSYDYLCEKLSKPQSLTPSSIEDSTQSALLKAIENANQDVVKFKQQHKNSTRMGSTLTCVVIDGIKLEFAYLGDSRVYQFSVAQNTLHLLSKDHTVAQDMKDKGQSFNITQKDRNILTRHVGTHAEMKIDYQRVLLQKGDVVMVCSDGLSAVLTNEEIVNSIIEAKENLDMTLSSMLTKVKKRGAPDNVTIVLAQV